MPTKLKQLRAKALLVDELHFSEQAAEKILTQLTNDQRLQLIFSLKAQKELFSTVIFRLMINTSRTYSQAVKKLIETLDKNPDSHELKKWQVEILFAPSKFLEREIEKTLLDEAYIQADMAGVRQAYVRERLNAHHIIPVLTQTLKFSKEEAKKLFYELAKYSERVHQFPSIIKNQLRDFFAVLSELRKQGISPEEAQADILNIIDNKPSKFSHLPGYVEKVQNLSFRKWYIETLVSEAMKAEIMKNELYSFPESEKSKAQIKGISIALRQCINEQKLKLHEETLLEILLDKKAQDSPEIKKFTEDLENSIIADFINYEIGDHVATEIFEYAESAKKEIPENWHKSTLFKVPPPLAHPLAQALEGPIRDLYTTFISSLQTCTAAFPQELVADQPQVEPSAEPKAPSVEQAVKPTVPTQEKNTYIVLIESIMISGDIPPYTEAVNRLIKLLQSSHDEFDLKIAQVEILAQQADLEKLIKANVYETKARQQDMMGVQQCALRYQFEDERNKAQFNNKELITESIQTLWTPFATSINQHFESFRIRLLEELIQRKILAYHTKDYDPKKLEFIELFYRELRKSILIDNLYYTDTAGPNVDFLQGDDTPLQYGYPPQVLPLAFPEELFKDKLATADADLTELYQNFIQELYKERKNLPKNTPAWKVLEKHIGKNTSLEMQAPASSAPTFLPTIAPIGLAFNSSVAEAESYTSLSNFTSATFSPALLARLPSSMFSIKESGAIMPVVASIVLLSCLAYRLSKPYRHAFNRFFNKPAERPDEFEAAVVLTPPHQSRMRR